MLIAKNIPQEMKSLPNWIRWKLVKRGTDKPTKVPIQPNGAAASSTDPTTWTTFDEAVAFEHVGNGAGFVFPADRTMFGIDLDGCRDPKTGKVAQWAKDVILLLNSYSEVSPSQTGVKIFCRGTLPFDTGKKISVATVKVCDKDPAIEAYDHGRYFAVTGATLQGMPLELKDRTEEVKHVCNLYFKPKDTAGAQGDKCSRLSVIERAKRYIERLPASVSGQGGHNAAFHAACVLVLGFGLNKSEAMILMADFNRRCDPPWSEKELQHKVDSAAKQPGDRGYLRDARQEQWDEIEVPKYTEPVKTQQTFLATTLHEAAAEHLTLLEAGKTGLLGMGIDALDGALGGGVAFGEYVLIGARPSHGKTAFAMQVLDSCCAAGYKSAIISEEMSHLALGKRAIQYAVDTPEEHWKHEIEAVRKELGDYFKEREQCLIIESVRTADAAADAIRWLAKEKGVKCIAIDYAQLLQAKGKGTYERVSEASKALRGAVSDTGVVLFVLAQLSREIEKRDKFMPKLCDLKESGQLEQDADVVTFLVWPHRINSEKPAKEFQIWVAKNRNRGIMENMVECEFTPSRLRIAEARKTARELDNYEPAFEDFNRGF